MFAPGTINSSGLDNYPKEVKQRLMERIKTSNYMSRIGTEAETASIVLFLLSDGAA